MSNRTAPKLGYTVGMKQTHRPQSFTYLPLRGEVDAAKQPRVGEEMPDSEKRLKQ